MLEDNNIKIAALKSEIEEGINSGEAIDFDPSAHLKSLKAEFRLIGERNNPLCQC
jgi:antitoxin ParD1/3/4